MSNICSIVYICCRNTSFKLKGDNLIKGVNNNMSTEIKYIQHADDLTLAVENIQSLDKA